MSGGKQNKIGLKIDSFNSFDWKRPTRTPSPTANPALQSPPLNHDAQDHIYKQKSLKPNPNKRK